VSSITFIAGVLFLLIGLMLIIIGCYNVPESPPSHHEENEMGSVTTELVASVESTE